MQSIKTISIPNIAEVTVDMLNKDSDSIELFIHALDVVDKITKDDIEYFIIPHKRVYLNILIYSYLNHKITKLNRYKSSRIFIKKERKMAKEKFNKLAIQNNAEQKTHADLQKKIILKLNKKTNQLSVAL